ncbi:helix-turn-helix domain-containing protein [Paenibacillus polymyxa]|uniref:helix-turn-helix domain-containing protein n=1 Tax=Paenibacillus polymyxa TaxID=1406 RepID=UPI002AB5498F|nr:helix-turn-helix domain-containing protein [Paenibacillus polymyxa]MDY8025499.1 helix-turn-helix domain-containing protein [Paenibacillus polymyxa]
MNIEKMSTILRTLTKLEDVYKERFSGTLPLDEFSTYQKYLNNDYIKNNNLVGIYWSQVPGVAPKLITDYKELDENEIIIADLNIALSKHLNFSLSHMHSNNYYQCIYIYDGSGTLQLENQHIKLVTGDFFVMPPFVKHSINMNRDSICIYIMLRRKYITSVFFDLFNHNSLMVSFFNKVLSNESDNNYILFHTGVNLEIRETVLHLFKEYFWEDEFQNNIMECYLKLLFGLLFRNKTSDIETPIKLTRIEMHYNEIFNYITKNFRVATLTSASEHVHLSKQYICRIISHVTGSSFSTLLRDIKLKKVQQYLVETSLKLEDIVVYTGFSDISHLSRVFKDEFGISPSKYRMKNN